MPKINIDELVEPIEVTVGGKEYVVEDVPSELMTRMGKIGTAAKEAIDAGETPKGDEDKELCGILSEILGAQMADIEVLGLRKRTMLLIRIMDTLREELEAKNVPKVAAAK